jgi:hypothetical protein
MIGTAKPAAADSSFSFSISTDSFHIGYRSCDRDGGYRYWTPACRDDYGHWHDGYFSGPVVYPYSSDNCGGGYAQPGYNVTIGGGYGGDDHGYRYDDRFRGGQNDGWYGRHDDGDRGNDRQTDQGGQNFGHGGFGGGQSTNHQSGGYGTQNRSDNGWHGHGHDDNNGGGYGR